jgi:ATP-dependent DNA helicase RecG
VARRKSAGSKEPKSQGGKSAEPKSGNTLADKLARIGVKREQDLVLHLPLRYEDRTRLCPLSAVKSGKAWQVEGNIAAGASSCA